ncbi:MAG: xanthine dehydrogenase family protein molybdopterin-binding subunit [Burkholderiales bacterium]|nr:xanthine dehydrogenase family protein molybdopterin-binding subunit [Burkholderiales bacterium]
MSVAPVPENLARHPRLGQWLGVDADGRILARSGKVDLGQGISHALQGLVAEELKVDAGQVRMVAPSTAASPDEGVTSGSLSIQHSGTALRHAAAHLREACRARYAARAGLAIEAVTLVRGRFAGGAADAGYAELADAAMLAADIDLACLAPRDGRPSAGRERRRDDVESKVYGEFEFINDMRLPQMLHGAVFRPRTLQAGIDEAAWEPLAARLRALEGVVEVVRDGLLVGVVATAERVLALAGRSVEQVALWHEDAAIPAAGDVSAWLKSQAHETSVIVDRGPAAPARPAARVFRAEYARPYLLHASIGLCCAIAQWQGPSLQVWSHTQGPFNLRRDLALAFALPADAVAVHHAPGAGCYGHNGADDVAFDAAWLARRVPGRPLRLQWTRRQELVNAPLGCAMVVGVEAAVDAAGRLVAWTQEVWSQGHGSRPGRAATPALLGAWQTARPAPVVVAVNPPPASGGGADRNAVPPYAAARVRVLNHRVLAMPLRVSALRSLGAHANVYAAESMIDEIARALGRDPLAYRLEHLDDPRAQAVLREAARLAGWGAPAPRVEGRGRGIAYARYKHSGAYCAVVADLELKQGVVLRGLHVAADVGLVVHADGVRSQLEGGAVQAASWTLCEAAPIGPGGIAADDWAAYPILGFGAAAPVQVALIDRPDRPSLGAGECSIGPTAAAIANAIDDALGLRMRRMPITAEALMAAAHNAMPD